MEGKRKIVYYDVPITKKVVALTFDIGNGFETAEKVLKVLSNKQLDKCTFFLSSWYY